MERITSKQYKKTKPPKYGNHKALIDGMWFDSKKEANRFVELRVLQRTGIIRSLERQVVYQLLVNGIRVCAYVADFTYYDIERDCFVVEDVKSEATRKQRAYRIKRKLFEAINAPLTITEI